MDSLEVKNKSIYNKKNEVVGYLWLSIREDGIFEIESSFPSIILEYASKKTFCKLKSLSKIESEKSLDVIYNFLTSDKNIAEKYGYISSFSDNSKDLYVMSKVYRDTQFRPICNYLSDNIFEAIFNKYKQHYLAVKEFLPNKYIEYTISISRDDFESKLKTDNQKYEYIDVYFNASSFIEYSEFDYKVYLAEEENGVPVLFLFE